MHIWCQIKRPIIIFHLKGHAVKLKCVNYKIFWKKRDFWPKTPFLKLENIHNFDTYFHPLRNVVLKLFDDKFNTSDQGTFTPVGAQGGRFHGTPPPRETTFPPEFCNEICTIYVRDIKNHNSAKKNLNVVPFQNGGHITDFYFAPFRFWPNFEKTLSQRNFSMKFGSKKENTNRFTLLK